jgi:hypothetical protein
MPKTYYIKNHQGKVSGPYSAAVLKRLLRDNKLDLSWQISADRVQWCTAARVKNLSGNLERVLAENLSADKKYRSLTRQEVVALFLDKFILNNEKFRESFPFLQHVRKWWAKLTLPKDFVITEVTAEVVRHMKYNMGSGEAQEIGQKQAEQSVTQGVRQRFNWFILLAASLGIIWASWMAYDFVMNFSLAWGTLKTVFFLALGLACFVYKTKRSKGFIGYDLDRVAVRMLVRTADALTVLRRCSRVWMYRMQEGWARQHWKYNAGDTFTVNRLPLAIFNRTIPNVETNIRVHGVTHGSRAIYFLPDRILVIDGGRVENVPYSRMLVEVDSLEYVEREGHVYEDSQVIDYRWRYINRDGSPDKRFKGNFKLPLVRCGLLVMKVGEMALKMMTTDPKAPAVVRQKIEALKVDAPSSRHPRRV